MMDKLKIHSKLHTYEVEFVGNLSNIFEDICIPESSIFLIDKNVWHFYRNELITKTSNIILIDAKEKNKSLKFVQILYLELLKMSFKRDMTIVSIGGGIVQDLSGFLASTLFRGVKWIYVPTTLLAQSDSCIGGKTSLNFAKIKNAIGTFYPPMKVFIYPNFLTTLSDYDFYSGLGEIIKLHIIGGRDKINELVKILHKIILKNSDELHTSIWNSLLIKSNYIQQDEFDHGIRELLNYGHTFGHAIESISNFKVSHGQSILMGMSIANQLAQNRGLLDGENANFLNNALIFPVLNKNQFEIRKKHLDKFLTLVSKDKKQNSKDLFTAVLLNNDFLLKKYSDVTAGEINTALLNFAYNINH